ncbi:hypothetical protein ES702_07706 [subsurface metagenome]
MVNKKSNYFEPKPQDVVVNERDFISSFLKKREAKKMNEQEKNFARTVVKICDEMQSVATEYYRGLSVREDFMKKILDKIQLLSNAFKMSLEN